MLLLSMEYLPSPKLALKKSKQCTRFPHIGQWHTSDIVDKVAFAGSWQTATLFLLNHEIIIRKRSIYWCKIDILEVGNL
jgi:hypothetical protein